MRSLRDKRRYIVEVTWNVGVNVGRGKITYRFSKRSLDFYVFGRGVGQIEIHSIRQVA